MCLKYPTAREIIFLISISFIMLPCKGVSALGAVKLNQNEKEMLMTDEIILRDLSGEGAEGETYEALGLIHASVGEVFRVLTAFEEYSEFMPNVTDVEILERDEKQAILNYTLGLPLGIIKKYRIQMNFDMDQNSAILRWEMVAWPGLRGGETIQDTSGYWLLEDFPDKKGYLLVLYHIYTDPGHIPIGLKWITDVLTRNSIPDVIRGTRSRIYEIPKE